MKQHSFLVAVLAACAFGASAGAADRYQVTGPIVEVTDTKIVVEKGKEKERHEFARDANTKVNGELKVGAKATVQYTMTAVAVDVKGDKAADAKAASATPAAPAAPAAATPAPAKKKAK